MMDPQTGLRKAREITRAIKYDNTVAEIVAQIQLLAEKTKGLDMRELKWSIKDVLHAAAELESAVYKLEDAWEEADYQERCREEEEEFG
jgi:hypothetical protein